MVILHGMGYIVIAIVLLLGSALYLLWLCNWVGAEINGTWRDSDKWGARKIMLAASVIGLTFWGSWTYWGFKANFLAWIPSLLCSATGHLHNWLNCMS